jgi:hypothetical protein
MLTAVASSGQQRDARRHQHAREHVPAEVVRAQPVVRARPLEAVDQRLRVRIVRRDPGGDHGDDGERQDEGERDHAHALAAEAPDEAREGRVDADALTRQAADLRCGRRGAGAHVALTLGLKKL